jgi:hypothetical protein
MPFNRIARPLGRLLALGLLGGGGGNPLQTLLQKFAAAGDDIALQQDLQITAIDYLLATHIGNGLYGVATLRTVGIITSWYYSGIRYACAGVNASGSEAVYTGTWSGSTDATYYGGNYRYSIETGATVTWTTPADATRAGLISYKTGNAGLARVEINGDPTLAHLLPTAQELVDAGTYANTILVANGGTLNPTDRVFDNYGASQPKQGKYVFADNLTAGAHTVKLTVTGYKRAAATAVRIYVDGWLSGDPTTRANGNFLVAKHAVLSTASVYEYAVQPLPTGTITKTFLGNAHGNDTQTALVFDVDGSAPSLSTTMTAISGASITVTRTSQLTHPEYGGGTTPICNVTTVYRLHKTNGLTLSHDFAWLVAGTIDGGYLAMCPVDNKLNRGANLGNPLDANLTDNNNTYKANGKSQAAYMWEVAGNLGVLMHIPNLNAVVADWVYSLDANHNLNIEDRDDATMNKIYLRRWSGVGVETIAVGQHWTYDINYRIQYFANGAEAALARP